MSIDWLVTEGPVESLRDRSTQSRAADGGDRAGNQNEFSAKTQLMITEAYRTL